MPVRRKRSRRTLIREMDTVFSQWTRRRAADHAGYAECFTCRKRLPWTDMHAGHFALRTHMATRWEPLNVHPQCAYCNNYRAGEQFLYGKRLDETYGPGTADSIIAASRLPAKFSAFDLEGEIERIKSLISELA